MKMWGDVMKILQVIHGYPMMYNAGSEVYTQTLCHSLSKKNEVFVFSREENPVCDEGSLRVTHDPMNNWIPLYLVNNPFNKDRYRSSKIDRAFTQVLNEIKPDVIHVGHLSHLSTSLLFEAAIRQYPVVFTLHDFWLMCPRGQFMQMHPANSDGLWPVCEYQDDKTCAKRCYARYFSGAADEYETDIEHWTGWVSRRMKHIREMVELIDLFIAPSNYLLNRYHEHFGIPLSKLVYLDYGFCRNRLAGRERTLGEPFTFGYIGTHIPAKGIQVLLKAFAKLRGSCELRIWGRPRGQMTSALKRMAADSISGHDRQIEWHPEYRNQDIVEKVFNRVDAIVVPSIWTENSPLVIHEAQQARCPVITADVGGMAEYVHHEVNGILFRHRDADSLAEQMQRFVDDPSLAMKLGARGDLYSENGDIQDIREHTAEVTRYYRQVIARRKSSRIQPQDGPWRITFDTNPDTCNLHCIMCEQHSKYRRSRPDPERKPRIMPFEIVEKVVREVAPHGLHEIIPSTMGEPLLYPDFEKIIALCHACNIKLNLTTNGTFPGKGSELWAESIVPVASDVKISINGASKNTQESIMVGSELEFALKNIRIFCGVRDESRKNGNTACTVTLQLTFLERNLTEIPSMISMAADIGVDRVKGHHVWTHFPELMDQSLRRGPDSITRWNQTVAECRLIVESKQRSNGGKLQLENFDILEKSAVNNGRYGGRCPFLGREAWINSEGRFDVCCAPDDLRQQFGSFGNVLENSFMGLWNRPYYRNFVKTYASRALCSSCHMRKSEEVQ